MKLANLLSDNFGWSEKMEKCQLYVASCDNFHENTAQIESFKQKSRYFQEFTLLLHKNFKK